MFLIAVEAEIPTPESRRARKERREEQLRARMRPLAEGERPLAITLAAVIAALLAVANTVAYLAGMEVDGAQPKLAQVLLQAAVMAVCAVGMWQVRYWAVLGFQAILGILIIYLAVLLSVASNLLAVVVVLCLIVPCGVLFWKLIRAMGRVQTTRMKSGRERLR